MTDVLLQIFKDYGFIEYENRDSFSYNIDTNGFGTIFGEIDFNNTKFTVMLKSTAQNIMNIYSFNMESDVTDEYINGWNTTNTYNNLTSSLNRIIEIIETINMNSNNSLYYTYTDFVDKLKSFIKML